LFLAAAASEARLPSLRPESAGGTRVASLKQQASGSSSFDLPLIATAGSKRTQEATVGPLDITVALAIVGGGFLTRRNK